MTGLQKVGLGILILATLAYVKLAFFTPTYNEQEVERDNEQKEEVVVKKVEKDVTKSQKTYVNVYYIGQNDENEEVYKLVHRRYNSKKDGSKIDFAVKALLKGPNKNEKARGIYSEVPPSTKLLSLEEKPDKIIINLSSNFEQGGGTDGLYKRLYQLIKTVNKNTPKDVYLYLDGKQIEVIGGEGLMINQPLNTNSLDE